MLTSKESELQAARFRANVRAGIVYPIKQNGGAPSTPTRPRNDICPYLVRACCGKPNVCGVTGLEVDPGDCENCTRIEKLSNVTNVQD